MRKWLVAIMGSVIVAVGAYMLGASSAPVEYREITVRKVKGEPDVERTFVDRFVYVRQPPELVVVEPEGGREVVEAFCEPDTVVQVIEGDTVYAPAETVYLLRSVSTQDPFWWWQKDRVVLYGPTSAGDLQEMRFQSWPGWSVRTHPDVLWREPRAGLAREILKQVPTALVGYALGKWVF